MSFCEYCGSKIEDGQVCNCPAATQARGTAAPSPQQESAPPPQQAAYAPPPAAPQAGAYPPPQQGPAAYGPPPTQPPQQPYGAPPPPGYPPQQQPPYAQQPGYYGAPPMQQMPQGPNQVQQTFGAVKNTLGGFIKDPYGMAARGGSMGMSASFVLLGVQVLSFVLFVWGLLSKFVNAMYGSSSYAKEYRQEFWDELGAGFWFQMIFIAVIGIGALFLCIFLASKIAHITINPKTLLSAQALSSIMMSAAFLVTLLFVVAMGFSEIGVALCVLVMTLGIVSSILLLEISLRAVMPAGTGNMTRVIALTCSYAITNMVTLLSVIAMLKDSVITNIM